MSLNPCTPSLLGTFDPVGKESGDLVITGLDVSLQVLGSDREAPGEPDRHVSQPADGQVKSKPMLNSDCMRVYLMPEQFEDDSQGNLLKMKGRQSPAA
jgi:hypothetical protein